MKIIKLLITMSVINALLVVGAVKYIEPKTEAMRMMPTELNLGTPSPSASAVPSATVKATAKPTTRPVGAAPQTPAPKTPAPSVTPPPKPSGCIIQIDGVRYEISSLQRTHSGGNVFTCGSDMSAIFWGRHNQNIWQMMQRYRI